MPLQTEREREREEETVGGGGREGERKRGDSKIITLYLPDRIFLFL